MRIRLLGPLVLACACPHAVTAGAPPRAEVQVALCEAPAAVVRKLHLAPRGRPYETWLFDDAQLSLLRHDVRMRLRAGRDGGTLTVKIGHQDCGSGTPPLVPASAGKCEIDVHGDTASGSVSLERTLDGGRLQDLISGRTAVAATLDPAQTRYLRDVAGAWPLPDGVRALGPIASAAYRTRSGRYDVDASSLPDGTAYVEISTKVALRDVADAQRALRAALAAAGVAPCADQSGQAAEKMRRLTLAR